ncbi:MAG: type II toxin-antitoxin system RelE/ParE family toxin [Pseudomonadales bacterium]
MDYQVSWSPEALEDVDGIAEYIAKDSAFYASAVVSKVKEQSQSLQHFAERWHMVPELKNKTIRELFVYSYRLIYRVIGQEVLIIAVIHGKQLLDIDDRL